MTKIGQFGIEDTFKAKHSAKTVKFRAMDGFGRQIDAIVMSDEDHGPRVICFDPEANVGMAVAVLGIGRIDANVEERARITSEQQPPLMRLATDDELIEEALVRLRAVMLRRERAKADEAKLTEDAYALYKLARPEDFASMEAFEKSMKGYWLGKLQSLRTL